MINILEKNYIVIPEKIVQDKSLTPLSKLVFGKIYSLSKSEGYCWATNKFLAEYFNISKRTIGLCINLLVSNGYIYIKLQYKNQNNSKRKIYIVYDNIEY